MACYSHNMLYEQDGLHHNTHVSTWLDMAYHANVPGGFHRHRSHREGHGPRIRVRPRIRWSVRFRPRHQDDAEIRGRAWGGAGLQGKIRSSCVWLTLILYMEDKHTVCCQLYLQRSKQAFFFSGYVGSSNFYDHKIFTESCEKFLRQFLRTFWGWNDVFFWSKWNYYYVLTFTWIVWIVLYLFWITMANFIKCSWWRFCNTVELARHKQNGSGVAISRLWFCPSGFLSMPPCTQRLVKQRSVMAQSTQHTQRSWYILCLLTCTHQSSTGRLRSHSSTTRCSERGGCELRSRRLFLLWIVMNRHPLVRI